MPRPREFSLRIIGRRSGPRDFPYNMGRLSSSARVHVVTRPCGGNVTAIIIVTMDAAWWTRAVSIDSFAYLDSNRLVSRVLEHKAKLSSAGLAAPVDGVDSVVYTIESAKTVRLRRRATADVPPTSGR